MEVIKTNIKGALLIKPKVWNDPRGFFFEAWQKERYSAGGIVADFVQSNISQSSRGVLRGLHFQRTRPQGKLFSVLTGRLFDVIVDIRKDSETFGQHFGVELSEDNRYQLWAPPGMAHGFLTLEDSTTVIYYCTDYYAPQDQMTLNCSDPELNIAWPATGSPLILSEKDRHGISFRELKENPGIGCQGT